VEPSDETVDDIDPEPGFLQDWNFIVLAHGSTIYDISTGILYRFHASMRRGDVDAVMARMAGHPNTESLIEGPLARDFWTQLQARVVL